MNIIQIKKWWCGNNHYAKGGSFNMALYLRILEIKNTQTQLTFKSK